MENPAHQTDLACEAHYSQDSRLESETWGRLDHTFSHHAPSPAQIEAMAEIRAKAKSLAAFIVMHAPASADRSAALRKVREAVMTANAAIVLDGRAI